MEPLQLDWSTAEVSDGELTVGLSEKPPKEWRDTFERTTVLLGGGRWEVALKKGSVQVAAVRQGDEDRVRGLLEGAALEANATLVSEQELFEGRSDDDDEEEEQEAASDPDASEPSRDEELTGRFREFAHEREDVDG